MSTGSSFREQLERRADMPVESQAPSFSPADVLLRMASGLPAPVTAALLLKDNGLTLSQAHAAITKLTAEGSVQVTLHPGRLRELRDRFEQLGLAGYAVHERVA
jgi:hypothetical protein